MVDYISLFAVINNLITINKNRLLDCGVKPLHYLEIVNLMHSLDN